MIEASVCIITLNEEKNIDRTLQSVKDFAEIIIVDSGSTDRTLEIARRFTTNIYHQEWLGFSQQKIYASSLCTKDYIFSIDADEVPDETLLNEIRFLLEKKDFDALSVGINNKFLGKFASPLTKRNRRVKFYHSKKGAYTKKIIHETIKMSKSARIKEAKGILYDYGTDLLEQKIKKINDYSSLRVDEKIMQKKSYSIFKLYFIFPLFFFKFYFIKRNIFCGIRGFIEALHVAFYAFLKEAKLYERKIKKNNRF